MKSNFMFLKISNFFFSLSLVWRLIFVDFFGLQILNFGGVYRVDLIVWLLSQAHRGWNRGIGGHGQSYHWVFNGMNNVAKLSGKSKTHSHLMCSLRKRAKNFIVLTNSKFQTLVTNQKNLEKKHKKK